MKNNEISGIKINDLKVIFNFNSMSNIYNSTGLNVTLYVYISMTN